MARSTKLVILIKNINTSWGRKRILLPDQVYYCVRALSNAELFEKYVQVCSISNMHRFKIRILANKER